MQCPVDGATLAMTERSGVEIDYCPQCRGVWLDRGELDKILARAGEAVALAEPARPQAAPPEPPRRDYGDGWRDSASANPGRPPEPRHPDDRRNFGDKLDAWRERDDDDDRRGRRKKGFLGELFDF